MLSSPIPGPPASVLAAILRTDPDNPPAPGDRHRATFSTTDFPFLPSLMTEVVAMPQYGLLDANVEVTGILVSNGWATQAVVTVTAAYTPPPSVAVVLANATGGAITVTLPDATQPGYSPGQRYTIIKTDSSGNAVTVAASAGQLINNASTVTLSTAAAYTSVAFDGVTTDNWWTWAASSNTSPSGAAGGALAGSYPNPSLAIPVAVSGSASTPGLVTFTNAQSAPGSATLVIISAAAGDRSFGAQVTGDSNARYRLGSDGKIQWGPGNATQDTNLYRSAAGTLKTDNSLTVAGTLTLGATPALSAVAATSASGFALQNATPTILTWTAPNDGNLHRAQIIADLNVTTTETGGLVQFTYTNPGGTSASPTLFAAAQGTGGKHVIDAVIVQANTAVTVQQGSALTAGAATLYAEIWAS